MKQQNNTVEWKSFWRNRVKKIERHRSRRKERKKRRLAWLSQGYALSIGKSRTDIIKVHTLELPIHFSTKSNLNGITEFLKQLGVKVKTHGYKRVFLNMSKIIELDLPAIVMLLTKILKLNNNGVYFSGDVPNDVKCNKIFIESGFLQHMKNIQGGNIANPNDYNLIVKTGTNSIDSQETGEAIKKAVYKLTGVENHYRPVQSIVIEMLNNAVEHAYKEDRFWLFCINLEDDAITFIISDGGVGVLNTLNRKLKSVVDIITLKNKASVLKGAFDGKYSSMTNEPNRYKGLPRIKEVCDEQQVENLSIITNNVYLNISNYDDCSVIDSNYQGTLYKWSVTKDMLNNGK